MLDWWGFIWHGYMCIVLYICHRHGIQVKEKMKRFGCIYSNWGFQQYLWCACTMVFLPEDQSKWLWCHQMTSQGSLVILWEGTIKGEHTRTLGLSSGSSDTEHLGLLSSHRPSTSAILVPLVEQIITRMNCMFCLSICMYPDLFGNFQSVWP